MREGVGSDRRVATRYPVKGWVDNPVTAEAILVNLSAGGAQLRGEVPLKLGREFPVTFFLPGQKFQALCRVAYSHVEPTRESPRGSGAQSVLTGLVFRDFTPRGTMILQTVLADLGRASAREGAPSR